MSTPSRGPAGHHAPKGMDESVDDARQQEYRRLVIAPLSCSGPVRLSRSPDLDSSIQW
jgi:hypothetical protein